MSNEQENKIIELLEKIAANQELQLERQKNALEMQYKAVAMQEDSFARAERLQERAEAVQGNAGKILKFVFALVLLLMVLLATLFF